MASFTPPHSPPAQMLHDYSEHAAGRSLDARGDTTTTTATNGRTPGRPNGILRRADTPGTGQSVRFGMRIYDDGDVSRMSEGVSYSSSLSSVLAGRVVRRPSQPSAGQQEGADDSYADQSMAPSLDEPVEASETSSATMNLPTFDGYSNIDEYSMAGPSVLGSDTTTMPFAARFTAMQSEDSLSLDQSLLQAEVEKAKVSINTVKSPDATRMPASPSLTSGGSGSMTVLELHQKLSSADRSIQTPKQREELDAGTDYRSAASQMSARSPFSPPTQWITPASMPSQDASSEQKQEMADDLEGSTSDISIPWGAVATTSPCVQRVARSERSRTFNESSIHLPGFLRPGMVSQVSAQPTKETGQIEKRDAAVVSFTLSDLEAASKEIDRVHSDYTQELMDQLYQANDTTRQLKEANAMALDALQQQLTGMTTGDNQSIRSTEGAPAEDASLASVGPKVSSDEAARHDSGAANDQALELYTLQVKHEEEIERLQARIDQLEQEGLDAEERVRQLGSEMEQQRQQDDAMTIKWQEACDDLAQQQRMVEQAEESEAALRQELVKVQDKLQHHTQEAHAHQRDAEDRIQALQTTLATLEAKHKETKAAQEEADALSVSLGKRCAELEGSLTEAQRRIVDLQLEGSTANGGLNALRTELAQVQEAETDVRRQLALSEGRADKMEREVQRMQEMLDHKTHEHATAVALLAERSANASSSSLASSEHCKLEGESVEQELDKARKRIIFLEREMGDRGLSIVRLEKIKERLEEENLEFSIALASKEQEVRYLNRCGVQPISSVTPGPAVRKDPVTIRRLALASGLGKPPLHPWADTTLSTVKRVPLRSINPNQTNQTIDESRVGQESSATPMLKKGPSHLRALRRKTIDGEAVEDRVRQWTVDVPRDQAAPKTKMAASPSGPKDATPTFMRAPSHTIEQPAPRQSDHTAQAITEISSNKPTLQRNARASFASTRSSIASSIISANHGPMELSELRVPSRPDGWAASLTVEGKQNHAPSSSLHQSDISIHSDLQDGVLADLSLSKGLRWSLEQSPDKTSEPALQLRPMLPA